MDRSRIIVAMALAFSFISIFIGIMNIATSGNKGEFRSISGTFISSGKAGIARIFINGTIHDGSGYYTETGADEIVGYLEEAKKSNSVKAVLLAINSPGGATGATRKIYDAVMDLRKTKPVVATVTDVAASGGYYIASASDKIFSYEGSILGSIGVISVFPDVSGLLQRYGVRMHTITAGKYKDFTSPFRSMTPEEEVMYRSVMDDAYQQFLNDVAEGRGQSITTVRNWADGKVFSGRQAKAEQLIDDIGGEKEAVTAIKLLLKTEEELEIMEPERDFFDSLRSAFGSRNSPLSMSSGNGCTFTGSGVFYMYAAEQQIIQSIFGCMGNPR